MTRMSKPKEKKRLTVETDRWGDIRVDYAFCPWKDVKMYKGFDFDFTAACWKVTDAMVEATKDRFRKLGLI
jgi:hypothetical protein